MKYFVILLVLISIVSFTASNSAYGLSCATANMTQSFAESDVVFTGKALSKEYVPSERSKDDGKNDAITQFSVIEKFKGASQDIVPIISSEWKWGYNFTKNLEYVVFAYDDGQHLRHQTCTSTSLLENAELEQIRQVAYDHTLSPSKQFKSGIPIDEIQCKNLLILVTKYDGSPACVKEQSVSKLIQRGWIANNNENTSFEIITSESSLAKFYVQPQITSIILKQDSTVRTHLFSYLKESEFDKWDHVFDRIFDDVPKNFKIGIIENTPENINEFVTSGKEIMPSGIKAELLRDGGYFVVFLTSDKSLEPGKYDLSIVSVDDAGSVIQKPLFVIVVKADVTPTQDNIVKIFHYKHSWGIHLENISEQEYWIREDSRSPWPPSPILNVTQENIHPDVKELIDSMWSEDAKYTPSEYDKKILLVENVTDLNVEPQEIRDWLEITYVQQFKRNLDDSFSSYIKYDGKIYSFVFSIAD